MRGPIRRRRLAATALTILLCATTAGAQVDAAAIVQHGSGAAVPGCVTCHGPQLLGSAATGVPRIAGLDAAYIGAQLEAIAGGRRRNAVMQPIASGLSADQRRALAAYISALPVPAVPLPADPAQPAPTAQALRLGARLAERGRWSSKLPGCDQCHGPSGVGVGAAFPPLSGQSGSYIRAQIDAYRQGTRPAGPLGLMAAVALRMTPDDIAAVAAYYPTLAVAPSATGARHP